MKRPPFHLPLPHWDRLEVQTLLELTAGAVVAAMLLRWTMP